VSRRDRLIVAAGGASLTAWLVVSLCLPPVRLPWIPERLEAAQIMDEAVGAVRSHCETRNIAIDERIDPNRTGLIGPELTPLMTTLGDVAAKRTTTTPDMAALVLYLLRTAGVAAGDTVAVGASASFPALLAAVLAACSAGGIHPVVIISLGASSFGATRPELTLLDLCRIWREAGIFPHLPVAVTLGGTGDVGREFPDGVRAELGERIGRSSLATFACDDLETNVRRRLRIYADAAPRLAAFVNIGGSWANLGTSHLALRLEPGLNSPNGLTLPPPQQRGVLFAMAARGVPVIHLLFIRGLARRHGLAWDPVPLPAPGSTPLLSGVSEQGVLFWFVTVIWLAIMGGLILVDRPSRN